VYRLIGGVFQDFALRKGPGGRGGHGTNMGMIVLGGVGWMGPVLDIALGR
jgi:hypothetical protein